MHSTARSAALTLALLLAACDSSPTVDVKDANLSEVGEAVAKSGLDEFKVRPGQWESKVAIEDIEIPGMPASMKDEMKSAFAQRQAAGFTSCLTAEQARRPNEDFFAGTDNNCRYDHFKMGDGKIDAKMRCQQGQAAQTMEMAGTYSPEAYTMTVTSLLEGGPGPAGTARMKMRMDARRIGECAAKSA